MKRLIIFTAMVLLCSHVAMGQGGKHTTDERREAEVRVSVWALFEYNSGSEEGDYPDGALVLTRCYPHNPTDEEILADFDAFLAELYPDGIGPPLRGPYITRSPSSSIHPSINRNNLYFAGFHAFIEDLGLPNNIMVRQWTSNWNPNTRRWSGTWGAEANLQSLVIGRNTRSLELRAPSTGGCRGESVIIHLHSLPIPNIINVEAKQCGALVDPIIIPFNAPLGSGDRITNLQFVVNDHRILELEPIANPITNLGPNNTLQIAFMPNARMITLDAVEYHSLEIRWSTPHMDHAPNTVHTTVRITRAPELTVTAQATSASCPGETGNIQIDISGGRPHSGNRYDVAVRGDNGFDTVIQGHTSPIILPGLSPGFYTITARDRDVTTTATDTVTLFHAPQAPVYTISVDVLPLWHYPGGATAGNFQQGRLSVNPTNNNHSFSWSGEGASGSGSTFSPPRDGTFTLTVGFPGSNNRTCTIQQTITIGIDTLLSPQLEYLRRPFCQTSPTGILHATQSQKDTLENSFFSWYKNDIVFIDSTGDSLYGMLPGHYMLCINYRGVKSCTAVTLSALDHITIQKDSIFHLLCHGASTGRIVLAVDGGTGNYIWEGIGFSSNTKEWTNLLAGTHTITIKDQADPTNCMSEIIITLTQPDRIKIRDSIEHIDCMGDSTGIVFFTVLGGTGSYTWVSGHIGNLTATSDSTFTFADVPEGSYVFTITDENKCSADIFVDVRVLSSPYLAIHNLVHHTILCVGQYHRPNPSPDTLRYVWTSISDPGFLAEERTPRLYSGIYVVRAFDEFNCFAMDTITVISAPDTVIAQFWLNSDVFINEITTIVHVSYPVPDSALWVVPDNVEIISYRFEFIELIFHEQGEHTIGLIAYKGACIDYTETKVFVNGERKEEILQNSPTLFDYAFVSPNPSRDYFELRFRTRRDADLLIQLFRANTAQQPVRTFRRNARAYQTETETVSVQNLPAGTYILTMQHNTDRKVLKLIIL